MKRCLRIFVLQESDKSQIFYWSSQTCNRIRQLIDWCMGGLLTMLKNLKTALFQTFSTWHRILSAFTALYWPSTAFYWPSTTKYQPVPPHTDPVPSWINHYRLILIQCHQVPTSRATYWPSTIMYQPVSPSSDPVPPSTEQYRLLLNQYHHISTSTAPYWPSTTKYQSIPTYTDPVPPSTNQYRLLLTQYHQVPTSTASHWPSTTKYQPVPPSTDPVPSYINQYRFILTQYHQVSTSTNLYCFCLGTTDSCTVYPGSCMTDFQLPNLHRFSESTSTTVTTSTSFELASSHARVTSIKFTKQELGSQWVSHWQAFPMIGLGSDKNQLIKI